MNDRQRRFADLVFQGRAAGRAYEQAGYAARENSADTAGARLLRNVQVTDYLDDLRSKTESSTILNGTEIRETLTRCIKAAEKDDNWTAVAVLVDRLCKMDQHYQPERVVLTDNREEIAKRVRLVSPLIAGRLEAAGIATIDIEVEAVTVPREKAPSQ
jgi:phage terminase small subunit